MKPRIILIQTHNGKYDLFIRDMPLGLLYAARMVAAAGYDVHIVDQRVLGEATKARLLDLLQSNLAWIGITTMTGEPLQHALALGRFLRQHTTAPLVWGGIHPTILPDITLAHPLVDYVVCGKGERSALALTEALEGKRDLAAVPGLRWMEGEMVRANPEDDDTEWEEMPPVPYHLVDIDDYMRTGFDGRVFPIMTSRNCPHKCTFCYNSALKGPQRWLPDGMAATKAHIARILNEFQPNYLSFIDDDFFVDRQRAREILAYLESVKPPEVKVGFRGVRISDLRLLDDGDLDQMQRLNVRHVNIGVESGSDRILKRLKKGMKAEDAIRINRRFAAYPDIVPLYNFFSGIPGETEEDIRASTRLILQLVEENPNCQISGFHQYTPYPGNELFAEAVANGFAEPTSLEEWANLSYEDNATNCPWIDKKRQRLLEIIYCMAYFVDDKYDYYFADRTWYLKTAQPFVGLYKHIAKFRLRHHFTAFPIEIFAKDLYYRIFYRPSAAE